MMEPYIWLVNSTFSVRKLVHYGIIMGEITKFSTAQKAAKLI